MFEKIFESEPPLYYLPSELGGIPTGIGLAANYAPELVTPPRIYAEQLYLPSPGFLIGAFVKKERTAYSDASIHIMSAVNMIYYPGYTYRHWWFDGITGAYLGRDDYTSNPLFTLQIIQARDGGLWLWLGSQFYEVEQETFTAISDVLTPSDFGALLITSPPLVDRALDLVLLRTNNEFSNQIGVYQLSTGALVRRFYIPGEFAQMFPEDSKRVYVVCTNDALALVDYTTGRVLSCLQAPGIEAGAVHRLYAWDRFLRRILVFTQRANATDGACLSTFSGYYPVPKGVNMTAPIPLRLPRANKRTRFLCRVYGDAGEGVPGVKVTPTTLAAPLSGAPPFTDNEGDAIISLTPDAAGTDMLVVSADV